MFGDVRKSIGCLLLVASIIIGSRQIKEKASDADSLNVQGVVGRKVHLFQSSSVRFLTSS